MPQSTDISQGTVKVDLCRKTCQFFNIDIVSMFKLFTHWQKMSIEDLQNDKSTNFLLCDVIDERTLNTKIWEGFWRFKNSTSVFSSSNSHEICLCDYLKQWFPTEVPQNTMVPWTGARGASNKYNFLDLYTYFTILECHKKMNKT